MPETSKPRARQVLDQVRALLGVSTPHGWACLTCGGKLPAPHAAASDCPHCRGQRVRAENLVRALRDEAQLRPPPAGLGTSYATSRGARPAVRRSHHGDPDHINTGALEPVTPLLPTRQWPR